jgi:hypothetical protein
VVGLYPVSDAFLEKIKENTREYYWTGTIKTKTGTEYAFENKDILKGSAYVNYKCCSGDEMEIGSTYSAELKITLFNDINRYTLTDAEVTLAYHLLLDSGKVESVPMGIFIISEANRSIKTLEITAYDRMLLLDKSFSVTDMVGTPFEILTLLANACEIELAQTEAQIKALTNGTESYSVYADNDIETWRDVLYYIAQAMCCFAIFNREGKLELRQYGMSPVFEIDSRHRFDSTFSDFKTRYTAISSTNARTQVAEYYALDTDDGLTMNLETNPMIQYGLAATRERILKKILNQLALFEYVPFDSTTIGNPALDVGDVIVHKGGHADGDSYYCVTESGCKVNGKQTLKGVGKNPRLASAKSKNDKNITGLLNSAEVNKIVYYNFINASKYKIGESLTNIISIEYVSTEDTTAMFLAQIILDVTPKEDAETVVVKITYKQGLDEINTFYPIETYHTGTHTLALFYPISTVDGGSDNQFNVFMNIDGGGSAEIQEGNIRATISGQGLAAGLNEWDGKITVTEIWSEDLEWNIYDYTVDSFISSVKVKSMGPESRSLTENIGEISFANIVFDINELDESLNEENWVKSFTVDQKYPPEYNPLYVELVDSAFQMISEFETPKSMESTVNYGRMSVLSINTEQFESVGSLEVIKC